MQEKKQDQQAAEQVQFLVDAFARNTGLTPDSITRLPAYTAFIEEAEGAGLTGPDMMMDDEFSARSAAWLASADADQVARWVHTLLRIERANYEWPAAVLEALQDGRLAAVGRSLAIGKPRS